MLTWSNTTATGASKATAVGPLYVAGNTYAVALWCPSARDLTLFNGNANSVTQEAARTSTTCFMRGVSEKIRIQTSSGAPWIWRRICFAHRGNSPFNTNQPGDTPINSATQYIDSSQGMGRLFLNQNVNTMGNTQAAQFEILFRGRAGQDWGDPLIAPIDTRRVDLKSDKTVRISSGNANGILREYKRWHPMNKNITYEDDENGEVEDTSYFSVDDKRGMGDYYIMDIFVPGTGAGTGDLLQVSSTATLYWHEK